MRKEFLTPVTCTAVKECQIVDQVRQGSRLSPMLCTQKVSNFSTIKPPYIPKERYRNFLTSRVGLKGTVHPSLRLSRRSVSQPFWTILQQILSEDLCNVPYLLWQETSVMWSHTHYCPIRHFVRQGRGLENRFNLNYLFLFKKLGIYSFWIFICSRNTKRDNITSDMYS